MVKVGRTEIKQEKVWIGEVMIVVYKLQRKEEYHYG